MDDDDDDGDKNNNNKNDNNSLDLYSAVLGTQRTLHCIGGGKSPQLPELSVLIF